MSNEGAIGRRLSPSVRRYDTSSPNERSRSGSSAPGPRRHKHETQRVSRKYSPSTFNGRRKSGSYKDIRGRHRQLHGGTSRSSHRNSHPIKHGSRYDHDRHTNEKTRTDSATESDTENERSRKRESRYESKHESSHRRHRTAKRRSRNEECWASDGSNTSPLKILRRYRLRDKSRRREINDSKFTVIGSTERPSLQATTSLDSPGIDVPVSLGQKSNIVDQIPSVITSKCSPDLQKILPCETEPSPGGNSVYSENQFKGTPVSVVPSDEKFTSPNIVIPETSLKSPSPNGSTTTFETSQSPYKPNTSPMHSFLFKDGIPLKFCLGVSDEDRNRLTPTWAYEDCCAIYQYLQVASYLGLLHEDDMMEFVRTIMHSFDAHPAPATPF